MQPYVIAAFVLLILGYIVGSVKTINQGYKGIVERFGRCERVLEPGLNFVIPFIDTVLLASTREQTLDIHPKKATTKDGVTIDVDAIVFWRIVDVERAYYQIANLETALENIVITTLRSEIGTLDLQSTISSREAINEALLKELDKATKTWGVRIERVEVQEIILSDEVRQALEAERIARSRREAKVQEAKGTEEAIQLISRALGRQADPQTVLRYLALLRYVEVNGQLSESPNSKIIFMDPKSLTETIGELIGADETEMSDFWKQNGDKF